jgi:hypothetical protein
MIIDFEYSGNIDPQREPGEAPRHPRPTATPLASAPQPGRSLPFDCHISACSLP